MRDQLAQLRQGVPPAGRAAVAVFFPPSTRRSSARYFAANSKRAIQMAGLAKEARTVAGSLVYFSRYEDVGHPGRTESFYRRFYAKSSRNRPGINPPRSYSPDFVDGRRGSAAANPGGRLRHGTATRTLELLARDFEDALKQVESVGKVTKIGIVPESCTLVLGRQCCGLRADAPDCDELDCRP